MQFPGHRAGVPERDVNQTASRLVNEVTESEPVNGEDLIESEDLKGKFREAKQRATAPPPPCHGNNCGQQSPRRRKAPSLIWLDARYFNEVVERMVGAKRDCTAHHPLGAGGYYAWSEGTARLRDVGVTLDGWEANHLAMSRRYA